MDGWPTGAGDHSQSLFHEEENESVLDKVDNGMNIFHSGQNINEQFEHFRLKSEKWSFKNKL